MPRRLVALNALLAIAALFLVYEIVREFAVPRRPSDRPAARAAQGAAPGGGAPAATSAAGESDRRPLYNVIAAKSVFSPSRSEAPIGPAPAAAASAPKLFLRGVVLDGGQSRAFLEDATSKKVVGYAIGDQVAGGRLDAISADRVVIARPDGKVEVVLREPDRPQPPAAAAAAGGVRGAPGAQAPAARAQAP